MELKAKVCFQLADQKHPLSTVYELASLKLLKFKHEPSNAGYFLSIGDKLVIDKQQYKVTDIYIRHETSMMGSGDYGYNISASGPQYPYNLVLFVTVAPV